MSISIEHNSKCGHEYKTKKQTTERSQHNKNRERRKHTHTTQTQGNRQTDFGFRFLVCYAAIQVATQQTRNGLG